MHRLSRIFLPIFLMGACGSAPIGEPEVQLAQLEADIFEPRCSNAACHGGAGPVRGLDLGVGKVYDSVVDKESTIGDILVIPGDPQGSLLYRVLRESVDDIRQMPPGFVIEEEDLAQIRSWIEAGAPKE